jgi:hypothetical protein
VGQAGEQVEPALFALELLGQVLQGLQHELEAVGCEVGVLGLGLPWVEDEAWEDGFAEGEGGEEAAVVEQA